MKYYQLEDLKQDPQTHTDKERLQLIWQHLPQALKKDPDVRKNFAQILELADSPHDSENKIPTFENHPNLTNDCDC